MVPEMRRANPVAVFATSAALVGSLVSGFSTFGGIVELVPNIDGQAIVAAGMASVIQLGIIVGAIGVRTTERIMRVGLALVMVGFLIASSLTSFFFYHRGFSEEERARDEEQARWEQLRDYVTGVRREVGSALSVARAAEAEIAERIRQEQSQGGGLRNLVNPYLDSLLEEIGHNLDVNLVQAGPGDRFRLLRTVQSQVEARRSALDAASREVSAQVETLEGLRDAPPNTLLAIHTAVSSAPWWGDVDAVIGSDRISLPLVRVSDFEPTREVVEHWRVAASDLWSAKDPFAPGVAAFALGWDLAIVVLAMVAGTHGVLTDHRHALIKWLVRAYGEQPAGAARRWIESVEGGTISRSGVNYYPLELHLIGSSAGDDQFERYLRQDGYLRQVEDADGNPRWALSESGYAQLLEASDTMALRTDGETVVVE